MTRRNKDLAKRIAWGVGICVILGNAGVVAFGYQPSWQTAGLLAAAPAIEEITREYVPRNVSGWLLLAGLLFMWGVSGI